MWSISRLSRQPGVLPAKARNRGDPRPGSQPISYSTVTPFVDAGKSRPSRRENVRYGTDGSTASIQPGSFFWDGRGASSALQIHVIVAAPEEDDMKSILLLCALAAALPLTAMAQEARSTKWVNLRAGPARDYPLVARLGPGTPLAVQGCTEGFGWCDVIAPSDVHGWIYAGNIAYPYQSADVPVLTYGAVIGFPIITFMIGDYWGRYYRDRSWYGNEPRWRDRPPMFRPRGRPPGRGAPEIGSPHQEQHPPGFRPPGGNRIPGGPGHSGDNRPPRDARPPGGNPHEGNPNRPGDNRPPGGNRPSGGDRHPGGPGRPGDNRPPGANRPAGGNGSSGGPGRAGGDRPPGGARPPGGGRPAAGPGRPGEHPQ